MNATLEHQILIALIKIVERIRRETDGKNKQLPTTHVNEAITDVITETGDETGGVTTLKTDFPHEYSRLILKPLLDANLLELLRYVLNGDEKKIKELIELLTNASFSNDIRLALIKILARAFERGNVGAEKVLDKVIPSLESKPSLQYIRKNALEALKESSEYTAQFYNIIQPSFNPQPRPRYIPKSSTHDDEDN